MDNLIPLLRYPLEPSTLLEWDADGRYNPLILQTLSLDFEPVLSYDGRVN